MSRILKRLRSASSSQIGSGVLPMVLAIAFFFPILINSMGDLINVITQQIFKNENVLNYKIALDSTSQYVYHAIRNQWCLDDYLLEDNNCNISHPKNLTRLIISDKSIESLDILRSQGTLSIPASADIRIGSMEFEIPVENITDSHPLFQAAAVLRNLPVQRIYLKIKRDDSPSLPTRGSEIFLNIEAKLISDSSAVSQANTVYGVSTRIGIFPRELSYFSLIVANDLYLKAPGTTLHLGDSAILPSETRQGGIRFESPIFVNGDLHLPDETDDLTPVIFTDRIVLGGGELKRNAEPFHVYSGGGRESQFLSSITNVGGVLGGIERDGFRDSGLDYLSGAITVPPVDAAKRNRCIDLNQARYDLRHTRQSSLVIKSIGDDDYILGLTAMNEFNPQKHTETEVDHSGDWRSSPQISGNSDESILKIRVNYPGGDTYSTASFEATMNLDTRVTAYPKTDFTVTGGNHPSFSIELEEVGIDGHEQPNQVKLKVNFTNEEYFTSAPIISIETYDVGYRNGDNRRSTNSEVFDSNYLRNGLVSFSSNDIYPAEVSNVQGYGTNWTQADPAHTGVSIVGAPNDDQAALNDMCNRPDPNDPLAYQIADWEQSFGPVTTDSWNFADPVAGTLEFTSTDSAYPGTPKFHIRSIANECIIRSSANFVTGFLTCRIFRIDPRTEPLTIIGTIITTDMQIESSAYAAGITWLNVYHPKTIQRLRFVGILKPRAGTQCENPNIPVWHPIPGIVNLINTYSCNAISLRDRAQPFSWTQVDPDCGLVAAAGMTYCKNKPTRFLLREFWKEWTR